MALDADVLKRIIEFVNEQPTPQPNIPEPTDREQAYRGQWALWGEFDRLHQTIMQARLDSDNQVDQVRPLVELGEVYLTYHKPAEAHTHLSKAFHLADDTIHLGQPGRELRYLQARCVFLQSKALFSLRRYKESQETLEDAYNKAQDLYSTYGDQKSCDLKYEITFQKSLEHIHEKKYGLAVESLEEPLQYFWDRNNKHPVVFREILYNVSLCLYHLEYYGDAKTIFHVTEQIPISHKEDTEEVKKRYEKFRIDLDNKISDANNNDNDDFEDWDLEFESMQSQQKPLKLPDALGGGTTSIQPSGGGSDTSPSHDQDNHNDNDQDNNDDDDGSDVSDWDMEFEQSGGNTGTGPFKLSLGGLGKSQDEDQGEDEQTLDEGSDISDWDAEFEEKTMNSPVSAPALMLASQRQRIMSFYNGKPEDDAMQEELLKEKYKFLPDRQQQVEDLDVSEPSSLFSMRLSSGGKTMDKDEFLNWIDNMTIRHSLAPGTSLAQHLESIEEQFQQEIAHTEQYSVEWCRQHLFLFHNICHLSANDAVRIGSENLENFFQNLENVYTYIREESGSNDNSTDTTFQEVQQICLSILEAAALLPWSQQYSTLFAAMMDAISRVFPAAADPAALIELEHLSHNVGMLPPEETKTRKRIVMSLLKSFTRNKNAPETACRALFGLHCFLTQTSPLTLNIVEWDGELGLTDLKFSAEERHLVARMDHRRRLLRSLYTELSLSPFKARVAHLLGRDDVDERLLFESVYMFDCIPPLHPKSPAIATPAAIRALYAYSEALFDGSKLTLGIRLLETAVELHRAVYHEDSHTLIQEAARLCESQDFDRCLSYYRRLMDIAVEADNRNETREIAEKLSTLYMERGDFRNAERYIKESMEHASTDKTDNLSLSLQLRLARVYLSGYYFERGIELLRSLLDTHMPSRTHKCLVLIELAEAYLKKRWLNDCETVLCKIGLQLEVSARVDETRVLKIAARCALFQSRIEDALFWVDVALSHLGPSEVSKLGRLLSLKARILHTAASSAQPLPFPLSLAASGTDDHPLYDWLLRKHSRVMRGGEQEDREYATHADIIADAVLYYERAKEQFKVKGDQLRYAKTQVQQAKARADLVFVPMCVFHRTPREVVPQKMEKKDAFRSDDDGPDDAGDDKYADLIDLENMEQEMESALQLAVECRLMVLAMESYIGMAELRFMGGRSASAQRFWTECRNIVFNLFMDDSEVVFSTGAPPGFLLRLFGVVKRLVRLLMLFDTDMVQSNLDVIDAFLLLERELDFVVKRPPMSRDPHHRDNDGNGNGNGRNSSGHSHGSSGAEGNGTRGSTESTGGSLPHPIHNDEGNTANNHVYEVKMPLAGYFNGRATSKMFPIRSSQPRYSIPSSKMRSLRRHSIGGHQRQRSANSSSSQSSNTDETIATMTEVVTERAWSCYFHMKMYSERFSSGTISRLELAKHNEHTLKRLQYLLAALRRKKHATVEIDGVASVNAGDATMHVGSLGESDATLVSSFLKCMGLSDAATEPESTITSLVTSISTFQWEYLNPDLMASLVYILYVDDVVIYYIPKIKWIKFQRFGGRDQTCQATYERPSLSGSVASGSALSSASGTHLSSSSFNDHEHDPSLVTSQLSSSAIEYTRGMFLRRTGSKPPNNGRDALAALRTLFADAHLSFGGARPSTCQRESTTPSRLSSSGRSSLLNKIKRFGENNDGKLLDIGNIKITPQPLVLLCSKPLQVIPWELLFKQLMTRSFSLKEAVTAFDRKSCVKRHVPHFFAFYSDDDTKHISPVENHRKRWIANQKLHEMHHEPRTEPDYPYASHPNLPFHTPLIRYGKGIPRKYQSKVMSYVPLIKILDNPWQIISYIDSRLQHNEFPVFMLTAADLADATEAIFFILSFRQDCMLMFVPEWCIKDIWKYIVRQVDHHLSNGQLNNSGPKEGYKLVMNCVRDMQKSGYPLMVFNPPPCPDT
eukprot:gb/GECH01000662.1/.p1 GENE.gb/GECH01000662.1/~~gb/GECH01000662.1/.p1  ORF type:complete len:1950 (+),score=340.90 gb/GECH01000662.1/:1-5850(+)